MLNLNKHKLLLVQILKDIYADISLANNLGFKGGTAMMFFYDLPRFSVDLDFNLLEPTQSKNIYGQIIKILLKYGRIKDQAEKHFGLLAVLDYGAGERNLKVEISNRQYPDRYEIKDFLGINVKVMNLADMFAHKLSALLDRKSLTNRDIFDCHFFMQKRTPINKKIVELRSGVPFEKYLDQCIESLERIKNQSLLNELGELMDEELKAFVRTQLRSETISLLKMYQKFPIFDETMLRS